MATIKLFLPKGNAKSLRIAEIINWTGKAIAAPRTELNELIQRDESKQSGVYVLFGTDPDTNDPIAYIGEAEVIRDRLKQHQEKDFWSQVIIFVSKDENLTKAHIRYLEGRIIEEANKEQRVKLTNSQNSNSKLPESDREDMEEFLEKMQQLLPVLGSDLLTPILPKDESKSESSYFTYETKGIIAKGKPTTNGFVVFKDSEATIQEATATLKSRPNIALSRSKLIEDGKVIKQDNKLVFNTNVEFSSPTAAASVISGGSISGLIAWKDSRGKSLKELY